MTAPLRTAPSRAPARAVRAPVAALLAAFVLASAPALAADQAAPASVVARVDGVDILVSDVEEALRELPPEYASLPPETLFEAVVEQLIDRRLVTAKAREQGLQNDLEVQRTLRKLEARVLEQMFYRRAVDAKVTDEALRRRYERDRASFVTERKVRARHILLKTREEALQAIAELQKGRDFAELARERSIGPSKAQGGDLGFFTREQMLPQFSAVAFSLRKGELSRAPVQTRSGWHVIRVEDVQEAAPLAFEEVRDELRAKMADEAVEAEVRALRDAARIERMGGTGGALGGGIEGRASPAAGTPAN